MSTATETQILRELRACPDGVEYGDYIIQRVGETFEILHLDDLVYRTHDASDAASELVCLLAE